MESNEDLISIGGGENKVYPVVELNSNNSSGKSKKASNGHKIVQVEPLPPPVTNLKSNPNVTWEDQSAINLKAWTKAKEAFKAGVTLPYSFRLEQLNNCKQMMRDYEDQIIQALYDDLRKSKFEAVLTDYLNVTKELQYHIEHLKSNMKNVGTPYNVIVGLYDSAYVKYDPYGVVLILGPWNYPFALTLAPIFGAIAAGNCAIIKPSELSKNSSALIAKMIPQYLDKNCYHVIQSELEGTLDLLKLKFDYILATGSIVVGKSIMKAAAEHLTPVTLELGGKCPVYLDESTKLDEAIRRIMWGKCINLGQSCVAPDYILCSKAVEDKFIELVPGILEKWYGKYLEMSDDLGRIINEKHFMRLKKLLDETKGKIICGGKTNIQDLWIEPTLIVGVDSSDITMQDEIFGPILPIVRVDNSDEAIDFVNARSKPLALYLFTTNRSTLKSFKTRTSSGQVVINDVYLQAGWKQIPFGGVGDSGMGCYHDHYSFTTFSHAKAILHRSITFLTEPFEKKRYPPHANENVKKFAMFIKLIDHRFSFINFGDPKLVLFAGILIGLVLNFILATIFPCIF